MTAPKFLTLKITSQNCQSAVRLPCPTANVLRRCYRSSSPPQSETRIALHGTRIATKQSELKLLAAQDARMQHRIMALIQSGTAMVDSVQEALALVDQGAFITDIERKYSKFSKGFKSLDEVMFDRILMANEERIISSLKRMGRILDA